MYSFHSHCKMIADAGRVGAYEQALRRAVKPGCVVLDIGTGLGIFALLACRFGARKVYAVEPGDVIQLAREMAVANGYADRIEFQQTLSTKLSLPEPADVIVADLRGVLPPLESHFQALLDARERLLAPGGVLIPQRDNIFVAVAEAAEAHRHYADPWSAEDWGLDWQPARRVAANTWGRIPPGPVRAVLEPQLWAALDYTRLSALDVTGELAWTVAEAGAAHGLLVWFDTVLYQDIGFSNAPGAPEMIYGRAFFPWQHPVDLAVGDTVTTRLSASKSGDDYVWSWLTRVRSQGVVKADFKQSSLWGETLNLARLRQGAADYRPALNPDGQVEAFLLARMDGELTSRELAAQAQARFPDYFADAQAAFTLTAELARRFSQ